MEKPILNDPEIYPDDAVLTRHLGAVKKYWDGFMAMVEEKHAGAAATWQYYRDGKSWLCKVSRKNKILCWISVWPKQFKVTFYFSGKAEKALAEAPGLDESIKQDWKKTQGQKFRPITILPKNKRDIQTVDLLLHIKAKH